MSYCFAISTPRRQSTSRCLIDPRTETLLPARDGFKTREGSHSFGWVSLVSLPDRLDLHEASVAELLGVYGGILRELGERKITRTANSPTGDYAEYLVREALGGTRAPNSEKSWDILTADGKRVQVKSRVVTNLTNRSQRQLSVIRSFDFDDLTIVLFDADYSIEAAVVVPAEVAKSRSAYRSYVNGHVLFATDSLLNEASTQDITDKILAVGR